MLELFGVSFDLILVELGEVLEKNSDFGLLEVSISRLSASISTLLNRLSDPSMAVLAGLSDQQLCVLLALPSLRSPSGRASLCKSHGLSMEALPRLTDALETLSSLREDEAAG